MSELQTKYALKATKGKDGRAKVALIDPSEAKDAKLYTAPEAVRACQAAGREVPYWDANGRPLNTVDKFEFRLNRWKKPYIAPADSGSTKAEAVFL